jgi:hypothetical protein
VAFTALLRPQLRLPFGTHPVIDASQTGIRVLHAVPARPSLGGILHGILEFPHGEPPLQVRGTIVRVERSEIALEFERGTIPPGFLPTV